MKYLAPPYLKKMAVIATRQVSQKSLPVVVVTV